MSILKKAAIGALAVYGAFALKRDQKLHRKAKGKAQRATHKGARRVDRVVRKEMRKAA